MEVVQGGALVCASRAPPSSTHPPLRLAHHRLDGEGPAAAALHVQTEEGGGGGALDPSWWRISASGSWDGGERRMRYGKLVDDRPGVIPGGMQRRKLEMLETHAPGASMRVVHSQSTASWRQDGGDVTSSGMSSSGASRSILSSSSSSSTRVTSYRQWSSNFSQTTSNISGLQQDTRPAITEFGNLELALNPLDVSFLRTRGNVGRSGSIGSRRPPTRPRRLSTDAPSPEAVENNSDEGELKSHLTDFPSDETTGSPDEQPDVIAVSPTVSDGIRDSMSRLLALGWRPAGAGSPTHPPPSPLRSHLHPSSIPLHRKRSVSSEDLRGTEEGSEGVANHMEDGTGGDNDNSGLWERGNVVRRSLPSSEWRSVVGQTDGSSRLLRPRDPLKSSSVPALGGPSSSSRKSSLVTAESLLEMKGRLKHRGSSEMLKATESNTLANGGDIGIRNGVDDCHQAADVSVSLRAAKEENVQDDRRKSWSVGCRNFGKREMVNGDEDAANRRRSYAFEYSADGEEGSTKAKDDLGWMQLHGGSKGEIDHRGMTRSADSHDFTHSRVNEMLKKWSAITQSVEHNEHSRKISSSSPSLSPKFAARGLDMGTSPARKSSTTWLDHGETSRLENGLSSDLVEYLKPATTISGSRTTMRVTHSEDNSTFKDDTIGGSSRSLEQEVSVAEDLPPSSSGQLVEDYSCPRELSPVEWGEGEVSLKSLTDVTNGDSTTAATSAGISVTFSNSEGGESHNNVRQRYSVTRLENKDSEVTKGDGTYKVRTSKKVEFSKTEVHFAAESGRFHIVETAGKPPPSNNFRRRRRSPTGSLNVDSSSSSSVAGGRLSLGGSVGGQSALSNGMRFGDSPYEKRLLAGTEAADISSRSNFDGSPASMQGFSDDENHAESGETSLEYISTSARLFGEQDSAEVKEVKEVQVKIQDLEQSNCSSTFLHPSPEESEKPKGILRSNLLSLNSSPWKSPQKQFDDIDDDTKPKFGGVRLRPVISPELHTRINLSSMESSDVSRGYIHEKSFSDPLSPGQMELQKLLKSLRPVSVASFPTDNVVETQNSPVTQVANGGGMEVRISSGVQTAVTNTVIIGNDSNKVLPPLSVAQRVREVEERRQRELSFRLDSSPKSGGRVSVTRVTLGPVSPNVESVETQVLAKKTAQPIQIATPPSPKSAAKMSTHNKIARIHNTQDKVGPQRVVRKSIREESCRMRQRTELLMAPLQEKTPLKLKATDPDSSPLGRPSSEVDWPIPLSILRPQMVPLQPGGARKMSATQSKVEDLLSGMWQMEQPTVHPPPSASWPSARGLGRVGDDRVMLKSPSLILQTMLSSAFPTNDSKDILLVDTKPTYKEHESRKKPSETPKQKEKTYSSKPSKETLMSGDKLQPKLSMLRALYRDAGEEECSDAYETVGVKLEGFEESMGESRLGDGGSVVSGSWRRMKRKKQQSKQKQSTESNSTSHPKPTPRRQSGKAVAKDKSTEPPRPPPRNHRNNAQLKTRRIDVRSGSSRTGLIAEERLRRRRVGVGGGECGGKGDASGHAGDSQHRNPSDVKASTRTAENRTRNEQLQDLPGFTCIAFGFQGVSNDTREHRDGTAAEDDGTGVKGTDSTGCKIFSALSAVKESKEKRIGSNGEDLKPVVIREKSPESHIHSRQREYKSSSPSKYLNTGWSGGSAKNAKEENRVKSDAVLKDLRSQKKGKEISSNFESPKKSHYAVISSSSQESKMLSTRSFATERIGKIDGEDDIDEFSAKLKVPEKRAEGRDEVVKNKPSKLEHSQRRTSVESTSSCEIRRDCEKNKRDLGRHETRTTAGGSTFTPRSPRLSEATRFQQRHTSTTITRPASPRQSPVSAELNSGGTTSIGSPASSRAVQKKRVRRRASGNGGKEGASGMEERRKGRKAFVGEEMSEESAILAELTRAADEILHAVNGYSDDLTSDDDAMDAKGATAAARSKRRAAKAHSKSTSSAAREAVKGVSNSGSSTGGMSKTRSNSGAVVVGSSTKGKDVTTRVTSKTKESLTKERTQVREGGVGQESPKISGSGSRNHHRVPSPVSTALTSSHGSSGAVVRGGNSSPLASEKSPKSRHQQHQVGGSSSPRVRSAMTRIEPTNRVAEVKLIEKRPPLPPGGPRRGKEGFKERTEVHTRIAHSKAKTSAVITNSANGDSEVSNSETKRTMNIARALEAVMPDARNKTRRTERKMDDTQRKEGQSFHPVSPQLSSRISLSLEKKKVASSRDGDKTTRRGIHHSNNSST